MTSHETTDMHLVFDGPADPEQADALIQQAVRYGIAVYCPLEVAPATSVEAAAAERKPSITVTLPDLQAYANQQTEFPRGAAKYTWRRLGLNHKPDDDGLLVFDGAMEWIPGYNIVAYTGIDLASLEATIQAVEHDISRGIRPDEAIPHHFGTGIGVVSFRLLKGFAESMRKTLEQQATE